MLILFSGKASAQSEEQVQLPDVELELPDDVGPVSPVILRDIAPPKPGRQPKFPWGTEEYKIAARQGNEWQSALAKANLYTWQIGIRPRLSAKSRCGGVLITPEFVLTAAHCLDRNSTFSDKVAAYELDELVVYGPTEIFGLGQPPLPLAPIRKNEPIAIHDLYKKANGLHAWDAAILRLAKPIDRATVAPVSTRRFTEGEAIVSGWGDHATKRSGRLRAAKVPIRPNVDCSRNLPSNTRAKLGSWSLCSSSREGVACARDSGGPLIVGTRTAPLTIGLVSWGPKGPCGKMGRDGEMWSVYTRTSEIAKWVKQKTLDERSVSGAEPGPLMPLKTNN